MISENTGISPVNSGNKQAEQAENTGEKQAAQKRNTGKKQANGGSFVKGQSGNPKGRPKGSLNKNTLLARAIFDNASVAFAQRLADIVTQRSGYDPAALKLYLDRIMPVRKDAPVTFELPPITNVADLAEAQISVMQTVAEGKLTPAEGQTVCAIADKILKTLKERNAESSSCDC